MRWNEREVVSVPRHSIFFKTAAKHVYSKLPSEVSYRMNAAIYARFSSDNQREESIEAPVRAIREYAAREGISIVKAFADMARSATTDQRPGFF